MTAHGRLARSAWPTLLALAATPWMLACFAALPGSGAAPPWEILCALLLLRGGPLRREDGIP